MDAGVDVPTAPSQDVSSLRAVLTKDASKNPVLLAAAGTALAVVLVAGAVLLRHPDAVARIEAEEGVTAPVAVTPEPLSNKDRPAGAAAAPVRVEPPEAPASSRELRSRFARELQSGKHSLAISTLDELLQEDKSAIEDRDLRNGVVDLSMKIMRGDGAEPDRLFALIVERMGFTGVDILYEMLTTRGGSRAAQRAAELLQDDKVRRRGTPAVQVAYELRMAKKCEHKVALFPRAGKDGDGRTLGQLQMLNYRCSRRTPCCLHNDPRLRAAMDAIKQRSE